MFRKVGKRSSVKKDNRRTATGNRSFHVDLGPGMVVRKPKAEKAQVRTRPVNMVFDMPMLLLTVTLLILGLVILYSASYDYSLRWNGDAFYMITRQLMWMVLGIGGMVFLAFFDYHHFRRLAFPGLVAAVIALVLVLLLDQVTNNAVRSLWAGSIRPSELAKLMVVLYVSVWLYARRERLTNMSLGLFPLSMVLGVVGGLIVLQPDYSAVVTILFLGSAVFFLAGGDLKQLGLMLLGAFGIGLVMVRVSATASDRIQEFVAGWKDPLGVSDHVLGSLESFVNGGWLGRGLGKGEVKLVHLPVPPTDSIFAVIGEEFGVVGAVLFVALFTFLLWRGLKIANRAPDQLGALFAGGLSLWLAFEAFVNMAVMLNLMPFAGNALPFVSSGGSNLVVSMLAIGIILNVARQSVQKEGEKEIDSPVDLRRGNRGRRVSRPDNLASNKG
jgi:cell division protein FtsW